MAVAEALVAAETMAAAAAIWVEPAGLSRDGMADKVFRCRDGRFRRVDSTEENRFYRT